MIASALRLAALGGVGALFLLDPAGLTLAGVLLTSVASLVAQLVKNRDDAKREERKHRYDVEDRLAANAARERLQRGLEENTALTRDAGQKADMAYDTANHINLKIASLASATAQRDTAAIRDDIAELAAREARK